MVRSQCERYLESLLPDRRKLVNVHIRGDFENPDNLLEDKPLELGETMFAATNPETMARIELAMQGYTDEQILSSMKSMMESVYEEQRRHQELVDRAFLRTICKKYTAITGKDHIDPTHGIPDDFYAVYLSVVTEVYAETLMQPSGVFWEMAARLLIGDWGKI